MLISGVFTMTREADIIREFYSDYDPNWRMGFIDPGIPLPLMDRCHLIANFMRMYDEDKKRLDVEGETYASRLKRRGHDIYGSMAGIIFEGELEVNDRGKSEVLFIVRDPQVTVNN